MKKYARETLNKLSHRRTPVSSAMVLLDSGFCRNDDLTLDQRFSGSIRSILLATALLLLGGGCAKEDVPPTAAPAVEKPAAAVPQTPPVSADALTLLAFKFAENQERKSVLKGSVSNTSPHTIKLATAKFTLFDKKGVEIGTSMATVDNLEPGFSWNFEAQILVEGVVTARFAGFTAK